MKRSRYRRTSDLLLLGAAVLSLSACGLLIGVPGDFENCEGGPLDEVVPCGGGGTAPATSSTGSTGGASTTASTTTSTTASGSGGAGGATAHCTDGTRDDGETDVDCGGACPACADGDGCETGADCSSKSCTHGTCATATCTDGIPNGGETDVDCGGPGTCPRCAVGSACTSDTDCDGAGPGRCTNGKCVATCGDGLMNGEETDVDCGGPCPGCAVGKACTASADCSGKACLGNQCGVASVSVGYLTACAVGISGIGVCWGENTSGERGDGTNFDTGGTSIVMGLTDIANISVGSDSACALTTPGDVWCWGSGQQGQLGTGSIPMSYVPVHVDALGTGNRAVSVGHEFACAVTNVGGVMCWGLNQCGQLGDGTITTRMLPVQVSGFTSGVAAVAAGADYSTCALLTAGGASCWGLNTSGQLGNGTTTNSKTPVTVSQLFGSQSAIVVGNGFACALAAGGVGNCWGANASGQLGTGTTTNASTPVGLHLFDVLSVGLGTSSGCGVTMGGGVSCWGSGSKGELGDGATPASQPTPATTMIQSGATSVSVGGRAACVVTSLGGVQCWGDNSGGQLGNSNAGLSSTVPVDVIFP